MRLLFGLFLMGGILFSLAACSGSSKKENYTDRMADEHKGDAPVANASNEYKQEQPVETKTVDYAQVDGHAVSGYLARPEKADGELPGIIVIHEWWGLNDNIRMMARRLAGLGYTALAVDLYQGKAAEAPGEARKLMQKAMNKKAANIDNLKQAYNYLVKQQNATKVGVIGWCFGGGWSLQTALALPDKIDASVIYYGQLVTDKDKLKPLQMPILGFFGGQDGSISKSTIQTFKDNLEDMGKSVDVHIYPDAHHAFANPSGKRYNKKAALDAWAKTKAFLKEYLE